MTAKENYEEYNKLAQKIYKLIYNSCKNDKSLAKYINKAKEVVSDIEKRCNGKDDSFSYGTISDEWEEVVGTTVKKTKELISTYEKQLDSALGIYRECIRRKDYYKKLADAE